MYTAHCSPPPETRLASQEKYYSLKTLRTERQKQDVRDRVMRSYYKKKSKNRIAATVLDLINEFIPSLPLDGTEEFPRVTMMKFANWIKEKK